MQDSEHLRCTKRLLIEVNGVGSKDGVFAKRAQFAENAKKWNNPANGSKGFAK